MTPRQSLALISAAWVLSAGAARADEMSFEKGPYLQELSSRAVEIRWEGSVALSGVVVVTGPGEKHLEVSSPGADLFHVARVAGLEPATTYSYVVRVADVTSVAGHFTTAPEDARAFSFIAYGDNRSDKAAHAAIVNDLLHTPSDFLVHTGDMVLAGDDDDDWKSFFEVETPLLRDRCVFACVGNHELIGHDVPAFLTYFHAGQTAEPTTLHATMRWGSARFFFLNAMAPWSDREEATWLETELTKSDAEPGIETRFVVLHHGPFSSGPHGDNAPMQKAGAVATMRAHHVDLVLAGHDHFYERGEIPGLRYLITGGGGAPLYKRRRVLDDATEVMEPVHHFIEIRVDGSTITTVAKRVDGSTMETCTLRRDAPWSCDTSLPPARTQTEDDDEKKIGKRRNCGCEVPGSAGDGAPGWLAFSCLGALLVSRSLLRGQKLN